MPRARARDLVQALRYAIGDEREADRHAGFAKRVRPRRRLDRLDRHREIVADRIRLARHGRAAERGIALDVEHDEVVLQRVRRDAALRRQGERLNDLEREAGERRMVFARV